MPEVAVSELRDDTRGVLRRVEAGEQVFITVNGRAIARLQRLDERTTWVSRDGFLALLAPMAGPALAEDVAEVVPDTTDDVREW